MVWTAQVPIKYSDIVRAWLERYDLAMNPDGSIALASASTRRCPIPAIDETPLGRQVLQQLPARSPEVSAWIAQLEQASQMLLVRECGEVLPWAGSHAEDLVEMGLVFGDRYEDNPLFRRAVLPAGWRLEADPDHEYWSYIADAQGRRRWWVYYKGTPGSCRAELRRTKDT